MSYGFIRALSNGCSFPTGIVHHESGKTIKEDANILEIMDFLKATEANGDYAVLADVRELCNAIDIFEDILESTLHDPKEEDVFFKIIDLRNKVRANFS